MKVCFCPFLFSQQLNPISLFIAFSTQISHLCLYASGIYKPVYRLWIQKIFGEEASKPFLLDFLNALLPADSQIKDLSFKNTEHLGQTSADRKSLFDIYCESLTGEKFIVELQKTKQNFFKDRTVYYSTFPIREQAEKGEWNYKLKAVFCVGILDFTFDDYESEPEKSEVVHNIKLKNQNGKIFYDKLTFIYLEMPNFKKTENELSTRLEKWLYFIKHLEDFQTIPTIFKDEVIFEQAFEKAELAKLDNFQAESYERSLREFRDLKNTYDYAVETAFDGGKMERTIEIAAKMKQKGFAVKDISEMTGLSEGDIEKL